MAPWHLYQTIPEFVGISLLINPVLNHTCTLKILGLLFLILALYKSTTHFLFWVFFFIGFICGTYKIHNFPLWVHSIILRKACEKLLLWGERSSISSPASQTGDCKHFMRYFDRVFQSISTEIKSFVFLCGLKGKYSHENNPEVFKSWIMTHW